MAAYSRMLRSSRTSWKIFHDSRMPTGSHPQRRRAHPIPSGNARQNGIPPAFTQCADRSRHLSGSTDRPEKVPFTSGQCGREAMIANRLDRLWRRGKTPCPRCLSSFDSIRFHFPISSRKGSLRGPFEHPLVLRASVRPPNDSESSDRAGWPQRCAIHLDERRARRWTDCAGLAPKPLPVPSPG